MSYDLIAHYISTLFLLFILLKISIKDICTLQIDNKLIILGFIFSLALYPAKNFYYPLELFLKEKIITPIIIFIILMLISKIGELIIGRESLGHGDVKLASMGSSWIGFYGILFAISSAFLLSTLIYYIRLVIFQIQKSKPLPFAPQLSFSIFVVWLYGVDSIVMIWNKL